MLRKLKENKYLISLSISVLIHFIITYTIIYLYNQMELKSNQQQSKGQSTGKYEESRKIIPKNEVKNKEVSIQVVQKSPVILKKTKKRKLREKTNRGYYGIGVYIDFFSEDIINFNGKKYSGEKITRIIESYPANEAGLLVGDSIFLVDGKSVKDGDYITGKAPKLLIIGIKRGNNIFFVEVYRDWVSTE